MKIVVTGAAGFVGRRLIPLLQGAGHEVVALGSGPSPFAEGEWIDTGDMTVDDHWKAPFAHRVDGVVHLAGYAHDLADPDEAMNARFREVNVVLTERIARAAIEAGARRFVFVSSVKVLGEESPPGAPFDATTPLNPHGPYARSKAEAEERLRSVADKTDLAVTILRPPLVYGPGVKANMKSMIDLTMGRRLIPVPAAGGRRSFIYVDNLIDAIIRCLTAPEAAGQTYLVSDGEGRSVGEMIRALADGADRRVMIAPIPDRVARWAASLGDRWRRLTGRTAPFDSTVYRKISAPLLVDDTKIRTELGWRPPFTIDQGVAETVRAARPHSSDIVGRLTSLLSPLVAIVGALMVRYDFFATVGGVSHYASTILLFVAIQYLVDGWLSLNPAVDTPGKRGAQVVKGAFIGSVLATFILFTFFRLHSVPRISLLLYPLILVALRLPVSLRRKAILPVGDDAAPPPVSLVGYDGRPAKPAPLVEGAPTASVIVVNYNGGALLTESVRSALASDVPTQVIVSDNDSTDGSLEHLETALGDDPRLTILRNGANLGFARANNVAIPLVKGRYLLFLNPDCVIGPDVVRKMADLVEAWPQAGMAGCVIRNLDGTEQAGCRRAVPTPWRTFVRIFYLDTMFPDNPRFKSFVLSEEPLPTEPIPIEALSGAFMFVRREALAAVGPMDENYFMHCEDLDWCMRFRSAGYQIVFTPDVEVIHAKGACSHRRINRVHWYKHKGMVRFYRKFFRHRYPAWLMWTVTLAVWVRFAAVVAYGAIRRALGRAERE